MGTSESKALFAEPWRKVEQKGLEERLRKDINNLTTTEIPNVLFLGHVGAGKSALVNSFLSVSKNRKVSLAPTGIAEKTFTLEMNNYRDKFLLNNVQLRDVMGIASGDGNGFNLDDTVFLLKGHIMNGYTFNPKQSITPESKYYRRQPKFEHETHCIVFVIDIRTMYKPIKEEELKKIKLLQDIIKRAHIPRVLILTQVDMMCQVHASNIFKSVAVEKAMRKASNVLSIDMASIHPVINLQEDIEPSSDKSILILLALRHIIQYGCDRIEHVLENTETDKNE